MGRKLPKLTDPEFEIMRHIWEAGETTVNLVHESINAGRRKQLSRTTIQVQMTRLEEKGWLKHRHEGRSYFYRATRGQQETTRDFLRDVKDRVFGGSGKELVRCLFENEDLSRADIAELKQLIDRHSGGTKQ